MAEKSLMMVEKSKISAGKTRNYIKYIEYLHGIRICTVINFNHLASWDLLSCLGFVELPSGLIKGRL